MSLVHCFRRGDSSVKGGNGNGHCGKKLHINMCVILNGHRVTAVWVFKMQALWIVIKRNYVDVNLIVIVIFSYLYDRLPVQKWQICYSSQEMSENPCVSHSAPTVSCPKIPVSATAHLPSRVRKSRFVRPSWYVSFCGQQNPKNCRRAICIVYPPFLFVNFALHATPQTKPWRS